MPAELASHLLQRVLSLPRPRTRDLVVERDIPIAMRDGTVLLADRWLPRDCQVSLPTVLFRSPYGRAGLMTHYIRVFAERGYQVICQSTRGTFGSGGAFDALRTEREDGLDTVDWLVDQRWFNGKLAMGGQSYAGYTQLAIADAEPLCAIAPAFTSSHMVEIFHRREGLLLEGLLRWSRMLAVQEDKNMLVDALSRRTCNAVNAAAGSVPLARADRILVGGRSQTFQDIVRHDSEDGFWAPADHRELLTKQTAPVRLVTGWYDFFLLHALSDFVALRQAGNDAEITVGPWVHFSVPAFGHGVRETLAWMDAHCHGRQREERRPVRIRVMGCDEWREYDEWPPPGYTPTRWFLGADGTLGNDRPTRSAPDQFRYDPAQPTPSIGGPAFRFTGAGRRDNRKLAARPDVLTYTTAPLAADTEIVGEVSAEVWMRSSRPHTDVFVRVCDVDQRGRCVNVCDGIASVSGGQNEIDSDGVAFVRVQLWPTAYRFRRGNRIQLLVASGAHPMYARNPGGLGEPRATATVLFPADQEIFHDPDRPSAILLPTARSQPASLPKGRRN